MISVVAKSERRGFETAIKLGRGGWFPPRYLRGDALDASGATLGSTIVLDTVTGEAVPGQGK